MLTFFQRLVEAGVFAAYHQHIAMLPVATPRLARLLVQRYAALFSFDQQTVLEQQANACVVIEVASQHIVLERLKQAAIFWSLWVLGSVWGWSWIIIGLAAGYGLRYTALGQQLALAASLLGITTFQPTEAMMKQLTRGFWLVAGFTTVYWAFGLAALCVGIVASAAILETPEGKTFLNWATSFLQYVWDRVSGVWIETLLHTVALEYEFNSESARLNNTTDLSSRLALLNNCAALQIKYQEYQQSYAKLRPAIWNFWARYRLQQIDLGLKQAWVGYRAQLLETVQEGLYASETLRRHPNPIVLVQHLVNLSTVFVQDSDMLARLPSVIALVCQLPIEKLTQPTDQPLVEGNAGRGLNVALLQAAGQASPVLRALIEEGPYFSTVQALETAIQAEGGTSAEVLPVVQQLLLKLPRIRSREVIGCLMPAQQQLVQEQLECMNREWRALGYAVIACLEGREQPLDLNALKLWRMTYTELQDSTLELQKQLVQDKIRTFFSYPNRVLSIEILSVLACLEPTDNIQQYQSDYLSYWLTELNKQYQEQHQALVVHNSVHRLRDAETAFLRQVVLPNNLSWFELLSLQQGIAYHPAFIAELSQQGCIGLSGVLLYCQQVPMGLLEGFSQQALVQQIQQSTALVVGNSVDTQLLTLQILQGTPDAVKHNIEMVNRLGALGKALVAYGSGAALPPELFTHFDAYLNHVVVSEGEIKKLLQEMVTTGTDGIIRVLKENTYYLKRLLTQPVFWTGVSFKQMRELVKQYPEFLPQLGVYYGLAAQREQLCRLPEDWENGYLCVINTMKDEPSVKIAKRVTAYTSQLIEKLAVPLIEDFHAVKAVQFNDWKVNLDLQFLFGFEASNRWCVWSTLYATHRYFKKNSCASYWAQKIRDTLRYTCFQELKENYKNNKERYEDYKRVFLKVVKLTYQQLGNMSRLDQSLVDAILFSALCRQEQDLSFVRELIATCLTPVNVEEKNKMDSNFEMAKTILKNVFKGKKPHKKFVKDVRGFLRLHKKNTVFWAPLMDYPKQGQQVFEQFPRLDLVEYLMFEASTLYREVGTLKTAVRTFFLGPPPEEERWAQWKQAVIPHASLIEEDSDDDLASPSV